jgi:hypothetical protein
MRGFLLDDAILRISAPCVLKLSGGLIHLVGQTQEELDPRYIWDLREKFEVLEIWDELSS